MCRSEVEGLRWLMEVSMWKECLQNMYPKVTEICIELEDKLGEHYQRCYQRINTAEGYAWILEDDTEVLEQEDTAGGCGIEATMG